MWLHFQKHDLNVKISILTFGRRFITMSRDCRASNKSAVLKLFSLWLPLWLSSAWSQILVLVIKPQSAVNFLCVLRCFSAQPIAKSGSLSHFNLCVNQSHPSFHLSPSFTEFNKFIVVYIEWTKSSEFLFTKFLRLLMLVTVGENPRKSANCQTGTNQPNQSVTEITFFPST